jgi:hypothetical protein
VRTHRAFGYAQFRRDDGRARDLITSENLVAARIEPVRRHGHDEAVLDLAFARGDEWFVVPTIIIPTRFVGLRECDPLIWPEAATAGLDDLATDSIRDRLLPWLIDVLAGRDLNEDRFTIFVPTHEPMWQEARRLGFLGAAPLHRAWSDLAPYVYARRFARERSVVVSSATAAQGHAALAGSARRLHVLGLAPEVARFAAQWFGTRFETEDDPSAELIVADASAHADFGARRALRLWLGGGPGEPVDAATTVPFDVAFAFSSVRGQVAVRMSVEAMEPEPPAIIVATVPRPEAAPGRVLLLTRSDAARVPDGDIDEARALAAMLRGSGFDVDVTSEGTPSGYDLVHAIGLHEPERTVAVSEQARRAGVPVVVSAQLVDLAREAYWGSQVCSACFSLRPDEANVQMLLDLLAGRRLGDGRVTASDGPPPEYVQSVRAALAAADAVFVASPGEERLVRERFGYPGRVETIAPLVPADTPSPTTHLTGDEPFALLLAPLEPRCNALAALRAAEAAGIPLVVAGPVADAAYCALLHEYAGSRSAIVEEPKSGEEAGLLARARLYLDCSWIPRSLSRLTRVALRGAALVAGRSGWAPELFGSAVHAADSASVPAIAEALSAAWQQRPQAKAAAGSFDQGLALERILRTYAACRAKQGSGT